MHPSAFFQHNMQNKSEVFPLINQKPIMLKGHCKRRGETIELAFMLKAASLGFGVAKPWGESDRYDVILDSGHRLWRVQVRSTESEVRRRFRVGATVTGGAVLSPADIDVLAAYIIPLDIWYLVPVGHLGSRVDIRLYPYGSAEFGHFEIFREAWHLFDSPPCINFSEPENLP